MLLPRLIVSVEQDMSKMLAISENSLKIAVPLEIKTIFYNFGYFDSGGITSPTTAGNKRFV